MRKYDFLNKNFCKSSYTESLRISSTVYSPIIEKKSLIVCKTNERKINFFFSIFIYIKKFARLLALIILKTTSIWLTFKKLFYEG